MNKFKKALCLILSLVLTITLIPANSAQAASSTKSLDFTIKIRNFHQQLSWDSLNTSILSTNFQDFSGAVTVTYNFEQNEDKPGCTPEIYLRTGWNESDKLESPHTITDKGQKSLTVKYPAAKIKKILNSGYVYVYGCNIKLKSIRLCGNKKNYDYGYKKSPLAKNGKLSVSGTNIVNKNGKKIQLKGSAICGITWFPELVTRNTIKTYRDEWNANVIRLSMYVDTSMYGGQSAWEGYASATPDQRKDILELLYSGIDEATKLGMYVIVDWHVLDEHDPNKYINEAKSFFKTVSKKYAKNNNILYEICNEPNGNDVTWNRVKKYADKIIPIIKKNNSDAIIIVGTPTWCQDLTSPRSNPIKGYSNIMYSCHFYAKSHTDSNRNEMISAIKSGLPVFVTEYGFTDYTGDGDVDYSQSKKWTTILDKYNVSSCFWGVKSKNDLNGQKMSKYCKYVKKYIQAK